MPSVTPQVLAEGRLFEGRWRIVRCLRTGGMGAVYEVVHLETLARSALKVLLPDLVTSAELRARFLQEVMVTASIESDHIVKVFDGGTDEETGAPFLVMELLRGEDLAARIARGPLSAEEVVLLLGQCALALERTHAAGVVHRDLKPANLFVTTRDDGSPSLKVLDYGIAKMVASASQAETTRALGTPLYMSPEQVKGDGTIAAPADLYALAQIAYTLLVGEAYWAKDQGESKNVYPLLMAIAAGTKEAASARAARAKVELPPAFDAWFARGTATEPDERFDGARAMITELAQALGVQSTLLPAPARLAEPATKVPPQPAATPTAIGLTSERPRPARSRAVTFGTGFVLVGAAVVLAWAAFGGSREVGATAADQPTSTQAATAAPNAPATASTAIEAATPAAPTGETRPATTAVAAASAESSSRPASAPSQNAHVPPTAPAHATTAPSAKPAPAPPANPSDPSDVYRKGDKP